MSAVLDPILLDLVAATHVELLVHVSALTFLRVPEETASDLLALLHRSLLQLVTILAPQGSSQLRIELHEVERWSGTSGVGRLAPLAEQIVRRSLTCKTKSS